MSLLPSLISAPVGPPEFPSEGSAIIGRRGGFRNGDPIGLVRFPEHRSLGRHPGPDAGEDRRDKDQLGRRAPVPYSPGPYSSAIAVGEGARRTGASAAFLAHLFARDGAAPTGPIAGHPVLAAVGADAYRRAGAQPPLYSEQPSVFRATI